METIQLADRIQRRDHMRTTWDTIHQHNKAQNHTPAPLGTLYQDRSHCYAVLCLFCRRYTIPLTASGRSATGNLTRAQHSLMDSGWTQVGNRWVCPNCEASRG